MTEYAIIGTLVALVAFPALLAMGGTVSQSLGGMLQMSGTTANATGNPLGGGSGTGGKSSAWSGAETVTLNSADGSVTIPLLDGSGGGTQTASIAGGTATQTMADQLAYLAEQATLPGGTPMPPELSATLQKMADMAYAMADTQSQINSLSSLDNSNDAKRDALIATLAVQGDQYAALYDKASSVIDTMSTSATSTQTVQGIVDTYSGLISGINYEFFVEERIGEIAVVRDSLLVGTEYDLSNMDAKDAPTVTNYSGEQLGDTAKAI